MATEKHPLGEPPFESVGQAPFDPPYPSRYSTSSIRSPGQYFDPPARDQSYSQEEPKDTSSLLDQLLPVPISNPDPSIRNQPWFLTSFHTDDRLISLRRICSLTVLFLFGLIVCWYASMYAEAPDVAGGTIGPVERQREAMEAFRMGMGRLNSFGAEVVIEEPARVWQGPEGEEEPIDFEDEVKEPAVAPPEEVAADEPEEEQETPAKNLSRPNWSQYTFLRTASREEVAPNLPGKRFVFIGDIHGSLAPLQRLLRKISYDSTTDTIIHVGDLIIKGPKPNQILDFMREAKAFGVRGNHDQKVIEWRAWMEWAGELAGRHADSVAGEWREYVDGLDERYGAGETKGVLAALDFGATDASEDIRFPKDWAWRSEHWTLARRLPDADYQYLLNLPLTLHLPAFHAIVVHAGLLARDPKMDALSENQLLPIETMIGGTRNDVEKAILKAIPQNQVAYNLLEMRSVKKNGKVINSGKKGIPWSDIWNQEMTRCRGEGAWSAQKLAAAGYEQGDEETEANQLEDPEVEETADDSGMDAGDERRDLEKRKTIKHVKLPKLPQLDCSPVTVIYGHAAARGLDIQPFSKGLDSACVAGHQLTAMVLGDLEALWEVSDAKVVTVGEEIGMLVSVDCRKGGK